MESNLFNENVRLLAHNCNSIVIFVVMRIPYRLYDLSQNNCEPSQISYKGQ